MATALQGFRLTARNCKCREIACLYATKPIGRRRAFSSTPAALERKRPDIIKRAREHGLGAEPNTAFDDFGKDAGEEWDAGIRAEMLDGFQHKYGGQFPPPVPARRRKKFKETFMNMGEHEPWEEEDMIEDDHDDLPSLAHGELEHHREMRHYARLAAWEMPLLASLAKPFEPPSADMPLRFRFTSYMGEQHPAEKKVVVEFSPADMPDLTPIQREKLKKLVGSRYNPEKDIIRMNCEMFETQAQNKRYLGDVIDDLLNESRTGDTFEDVPLDLRHHHFKSKPKFPMEWALTEERKKELAGYREKMLLKDQKLESAGQLVDGLRKIQERNAVPLPTREALPEMVPVGKAKGKKVSVRR